MPYKLTDEKNQTYGGCQWGENITHTATGKGETLCRDGVIHYYEDAFQAVFANPLHGNFSKPILWDFKPERRIGGDALKSACKTGTTLKQLPLPTLTTEQRVEIAIRCVMAVYHDKSWVDWARKWLNGEDRTADAAYGAAYAAAHAADAAADAAYAAAHAAAHAATANADAAFYAAYAAADAANAATYAAAHAAAHAAYAAYNLNIVAIIHKVVERTKKGK